MGLAVPCHAHAGLRIVDFDRFADFYTGYWDFHLGELGISVNLAIFSGIFCGFVITGMGFFRGMRFLGIFIPLIGDSSKSGDFYPLNFLGMGIFRGWRFFSWDGIFHQKGHL